MTHDQPWWRDRLPPDHDFVSDIDAVGEHLELIDEADLPEEMRAIALLEPPGHLVPAPVTHAGWSFYLEMADVRFPRDDGKDELPRPVVLIDIARHNEAVREEERRAG